MKKFYIRTQVCLVNIRFVEVKARPVVNEWKIDLFARKVDKEWQVSENRTGLLIAKGKTRAVACEYAFQRVRENPSILAAIKGEPIVSPAYGGESLVLGSLATGEKRFREIFGLDLREFWDFMYGVDLGFDVVKFACHVKPRHDESVAEAIERRWGVEARVFVSALLNQEKTP